MPSPTPASTQKAKKLPGNCRKIAKKCYNTGRMITTLLFDFSRVLLFAKSTSYNGELNALHQELSLNPNYNFLNNFELNGELLSYLDSIKNKISLYIFTSGTIQNAPEIKDKIEKVFKKVFSAGDLGISKSDPDAYKLVAESLGINAEEILFIDDMEKNINAARKANLQTYLYQNNKDLVEEIESILQ
jgi:HAD superfamily hydrolase (TIGR01549 family)